MFRTTTLIVDEKLLQEWLRRQELKDRAEGRTRKVALSPVEAPAMPTVDPASAGTLGAQAIS